ncbi:unnamed protein product [Cylicostephanus goldi]|uniref:Uncharacterized protein n=1 Tax=Cylicostephanus goldi TaxID=71465 RepID=A0A3P7NE59_CYLGO|nr:unnamed protein product [Cylicostephanus goldi]
MMQPIFLEIFRLCSFLDKSSLCRAALQRYLTYKSPVYIITDALPNDLDAMESIFHLDSYWRVPVGSEIQCFLPYMAYFLNLALFQLNFIYLEPAPSADCATTIESPDYRAMDSLAQRTGGMTFYFPYNKQDQIESFLYQHMYGTIYRSQLLLLDDLPVCANQKVFNPISIDVSAEQMVIVATGKNLSLVLTTPEGDLSTYDTVYNDGVNYVW